ncbi:hypothetical protein Cni_G20041 [Canna indica]|uniref:Uncharacterized protein n=1 Tax=Canna indica TaxID=4628 RepID=A0AAQ3QHG0_9LILI|nr:hypothetical protein Cni_G20041 [Canna indica]
MRAWGSAGRRALLRLRQRLHVLPFPLSVNVSMERSSLCLLISMRMMMRVSLWETYLRCPRDIAVMNRGGWEGGGRWMNLGIWRGGGGGGVLM